MAIVYWLGHFSRVPGSIPCTCNEIFTKIHSNLFDNWGGHLATPVLKSSPRLNHKYGSKHEVHMRAWRPAEISASARRQAEISVCLRTPAEISVGLPVCLWSSFRAKSDRNWFPRSRGMISQQPLEKLQNGRNSIFPVSHGNEFNHQKSTFFIGKVNGLTD